MICSIINEGTAPRHALGGSLPASKPVAPKRHQYTRCGSGYPDSSPAPGQAEHSSPAAHDPRLVARPITVLIHSPLVVLLFTLGETNGQFRPTVFPIQLQGNERVTLALHRTDET